MLKKDPAERLSVTECLEHQFLTKEKEKVKKYSFHSTEASEEDLSQVSVKVRVKTKIKGTYDIKKGTTIRGLRVVDAFKR